MIVNFPDIRGELTTYDCRHLQTGQIREGDFTLLDNKLFMVENVARNCPHIENLSKRYTRVLVKDSQGNSLSLAGIETWEIFRRHKE